MGNTMLTDWFGRKSKDRSPRAIKTPVTGVRVREPKRPVIDRAQKQPPLDADRDFVYHER
jgi:hypothetical protein